MVVVAAPTSVSDTPVRGRSPVPGAAAGTGAGSSPGRSGTPRTLPSPLVRDVSVDVVPGPVALDSSAAPGRLARRLIGRAPPWRGCGRPRLELEA